ncbi:MAG TPA: MerC domain-containing protein [Flavobacteriales bacterium]|nr:MerC domain-containing protein [Flavobacteriales bacterium]
MRTVTARWKGLLRTGDGLGIINSAICIVHCLAMPLLIAAGAGFFEHPSVSWVFIVLAFLAVRSAIRSNRNAPVAMVLGIGWGLFAFALALEGVDERLELLAYAGSAILIIGHILNWLDLRP